MCNDVSIPNVIIQQYSNDSFMLYNFTWFSFVIFHFAIFKKWYLRNRYKKSLDRLQSAFFFLEYGYYFKLSIMLSYFFNEKEILCWSWFYFCFYFAKFFFFLYKRGWTITHEINKFSDITVLETLLSKKPGMRTGSI